MSDIETTEESAPEIWRPSVALDPARFQFLWTLAEKLAATSIVPDSMRFEGKKGDRRELPFERVVSNVFLVVDQADAWNIRPTALLACASIVHGKLGYEGKVIAAVLKARFGIDLDYEWSGEGDDMSITVTGVKPGSDAPLSITGSVSQWKTTGDGSPWRPREYRKMLAYRGAREWARLHEPAAIMGILSEDELYEIEMERRAMLAQEVSLTQRLSGNRNAPGFDPDQAQRQLQDASGLGLATEVTEMEAVSTAPEEARDKPKKSAKKEPKEDPKEAREPEKEENLIEVSKADLRGYSEALMRAEQIKTLPTLKEQYWTGKPINFDAASIEKLKKVYTAHARRIAGEIELDELDRIIAEIVG